MLPAAAGRVYVHGQRRRDLHILTWEIETAPVFGRVRLVLHELLSGVGSPQTHQPDRLPPVGTDVLIRAGLEFGQTEFHGIVARHQVEATEAGEQLIAEVEHQLYAELKVPLVGRWQMTEGQLVRTDTEVVRFNTSPGLMGTAELQQIGARTCRLFDPSGEGLRWTVPDALGYLLATELPESIETPSLDELNQLAGGVDLGEYNASGTTLGTAMVEIAHRGGLEIRSSRSGVGIVVYRPGQGGRRSSIRLQAAGETFRPAGSNITDSRILLASRPSRPPVRVIGGYKRYEATFTLQPGWICDSSEEFRRWVLNEYGQCEYVMPFDFATISQEDFLVRKGRQFLQCVSTDTYNASWGIVVEFRLSDVDPWESWNGPVSTWEQECSITLGGNELPSGFIAAAAAGEAEVRVTASVESDRRIEALIDGDVGLVTEVYDLSAQAAWWAVHPDSIFHTGVGSSLVVLRNDSPRLEAFAHHRKNIAARSTRATITLGWIDLSCCVGDIIERVDGQAMELSSQPHSRPAVTSVRHDFEETQQTRFVLEG